MKLFKGKLFNKTGIPFIAIRFDHVMEQENKVMTVNGKNQWQRIWSKSCCLCITLSIIWIIISNDHSRYCKIPQCKVSMIIWEKWYLQYHVKSDNKIYYFNRITNNWDIWQKLYNNFLSERLHGQTPVWSKMRCNLKTFAIQSKAIALLILYSAK